MKGKQNPELDGALQGILYPCTILMDRYDGVYSGAKWLAFHEDPALVPQEIGGEDLDEQGFWIAYNNESNPKPIGKGETPDNAYKDLLEKIISWYKNDRITGT